MAEFRTQFIDFDSRPRPKTNHFCIMCQRDFKQGQAHRRVLCVSGEPFAIHPEDTHLAADKETEWFEIGMDCARKLGLEWTHPATVALNDGSRRPETQMSEEDLAARAKVQGDYAAHMKDK